MIHYLRLTLQTLIVSLSFLLINDNKLHACTGHDLIFTNITITAISSDEYTCTYQLKNIGTAAVPVNDIVIQNYVSTDDIEGNDVAAGGSFINNQSTAFIQAGATYDGVMWIYPQGRPLSSHPYLISDVYLDKETECDLTNNQYIGLIQLTATSTQSARFANADVVWNADIKLLSVKNWSGNTSVLQYSVYSMSGPLILSGNTKEGESTPLALMQHGMYILYLSDGEKIYSKKIIY